MAVKSVGDGDQDMIRKEETRARVSSANRGELLQEMQSPVHFSGGLRYYSMDERARVIDESTVPEIESELHFSEKLRYCSSVELVGRVIDGDGPG